MAFNMVSRRSNSSHSARTSDLLSEKALQPHLNLFLRTLFLLTSSDKLKNDGFICRQETSLSEALFPEPSMLSIKPPMQREGKNSSFVLLTLGYGYCLALGYSAPVNRGMTILGTKESFIIRKASLSPSGDHQWAI